MADSAPEVTREGDVTIVTLGPAYENIEDKKLPDLQKTLLEIADETDPPLVVLNLSNTNFFGSAFIEVLFRLHNRMKDRGGKFAICCLTPYCREIIEITHLDRVWTIKLSQEEAIEAITAE